MGKPLLSTFQLSLYLRRDPPAVLATLLRAVEEEEETDLVKEAWEAIEEALEPVLRSPAYRPLRGLEDDPVGQKEMKDAS